MKTWSRLKKDNRGASLIAVLVAIAVVGVMGTVIMQLTVTNIQLKEVERQSKTNFYTAEEILDRVTANINEKAAEQMQAAFTDILSKYRNYEGASSGLKSMFSKKYLDGMVKIFDATLVGEGDSATSEAQKKMDPEDSSRVLYTIGYYKIPLIASFLPGGGNDPEGKFGIEIPAADATHPDGAKYFHADYDKGTFTLDNICVFAKDQFGNVTKIRTDLVFHTPDLNLDGSNVVKEFMRYSLIADRQILAQYTGIEVDGNVYAGADGILADYGSSASFIGKKIVTRGDVKSKSSATLKVGNDDTSVSQLWVQNYKTVRDNTRVTLVDANASNAAKLYISGTSYVSDDLEVNGAYDTVGVKGNYYGYNFQENYEVQLGKPDDAKFSSAIAINGKDSNVDISGLNKLTLAGRAFISRSTGVGSNDDIMTGEALSVRVNQLAYYVPRSCMPEVDGTPMFDKDRYQAYSGIDVTPYVNLLDPVSEFNYETGGKPVYYLKFKSEQAANNFYKVYYDARKVTMNLRMENYLTENALMLNNDVVLNLKGDLLYRTGAGELAELQTMIDSSLWNRGNSFYKFAADHAMKYKSLCLTLEENKLDRDYSNVRLQDSDPTLFNNLISADQWNAFFESHEDITETNWEDPLGNISGTKLIAIVNNKSGATYEVKTDTWSGGIVIANGDVHISGNALFSGLIISGGTITFDAGAKVRADEVLVSNMIANDITLRNPTFANIFKDYASSANDALNGTSIERYMTMENWTKTVD